MDHYIDIRLLPDPEFDVNMLMGALCSKLHRVLAERKETAIGISFPDHALKPRRTLGATLRLHSGRERLMQLMTPPWLEGMRDHTDISELATAPNHVQFRTVRRRQFKTSVERLRRRRMQRHGETMEQACKAIPDSIEQRVHLPSVMMRSRSTGQSFNLFIEHGPVQDDPISGSFNSYGLSQTATVPWF